MIPQSKGKIYLAEERGLNETDWFRSYNTFNFGKYQHEFKKPFGSLYVLNEDTLGGGQSLKWLMEEDTDVILIPVVGAVAVQDGEGNETLVEAGEVQVLHLKAGSTCTTKNPYQDDLVKYLQLWVKSSGGLTLSSKSGFDLENYQPAEIFSQAVSEGAGYAGTISKLKGRQEIVYHKKKPENGIFVFAIQGELEVQYRLMHEGDGLALWELDEIEVEALSNDAILLILEVPLLAQEVV
jgi:redox-sensitive bicupin YhaK (pirin superfamily)